MNKDLPKMYTVKLDKEINNNEQVFSTLDRSNNKIINNNKIDRFAIEQKIYKLFNSKDYIYKIDVNILTEEGLLKKKIIGKKNNNLITMDNEYIPISKIKDIYKS